MSSAAFSGSLRPVVYKIGNGPKRHNAALVCLARRRIDVIYAMLRDRKPYQQHAPATPEPSPAAA